MKAIDKRRIQVAQYKFQDKARFEKGNSWPSQKAFLTLPRLGSYNNLYYF